jgi:hypothetical protein
MAAARHAWLQLYISAVRRGEAAMRGTRRRSPRTQGSTALRFPLSVTLAGITVTATLDAKNLVTKVVYASMTTPPPLSLVL